MGIRGSGASAWRCALAASAAAALLAVPSASAAELSLHRDADRADVMQGAALSADQLDDRPFRRLLRRQVNALTFEDATKWALVHPRPNRYDFSGADRIATFARRNGLHIRGHVLLWHYQNPPWLLELSPTRAEALTLLRRHISRVVGHFRRHFPGLITQWDVVNEPIDSDGTRRNTIWQRWIGDDYIDHAFRFARKAAGRRVKLFLNEYFDAGMVAGSEFLTGGTFDDGDLIPFAFPGALGALPCSAVVKCVAIRRLVADMIERGVPIDGVGFQGHIPNPLPSDYRGLTAWVGELGLDWALTEVDVPVPRGTSENPLAADHQVRAYRGALSACVDDPACGTFVTWGLSDRYTWWDDLVGGLLSEPLPFDVELEPKPAAFAIRDVLAAASTPG
jgi:endo-1,4-beta-xylanase